MAKNEPSKTLQSHAADEGAVVVIPKSPMSSKVLWLSILNMVVGITTYLIGPDVVKNYPAEFVMGISLLNGIASAILRVFTSAPLTISPSAPPTDDNQPSTTGYKVSSSFGVLAVIVTLVFIQESYAQESATPAAKPAIIKLSPSASDRPVADATRDGTDGQPAEAALLGRRVLSLRKAEGMGFSVRSIKAAVKELKASEDPENQIVQGETTEAEASVLVAAKIRANHAENEAISDWDWAAIFAFIERILRLFGLVIVCSGGACFRFLKRIGWHSSSAQ